MANWKQVTLTNAGRELAAAVTAGQLKLNITEIWFGSGTPADLETATDLAAKKIKADIVSIKQQDMECLITFRVSNEGQASAIVLSEMGFYAKGASGGNILFSVTTDDQPATLPAQGSGPVYRQTMTMSFGYSNAENVEIDSTIIDGTPEEDVATMINEHNESSSAHQDIRQSIEDQIDDHNSNASAHADAFSTHNTSGAAHENRFSLFQKIATLGDDIIKKLALTTTITVITALQTNSWFGQLLKMVLNASGVKYSMAPNGYICLGSFFGGLIIQWINTTATRSGVKFSYPISMTLYAQIITHNGSTPGATGLENNTAYDDWSTTQAAPVWIIAIGR